MQERTVTVEGKTHQLPDPFLVIATQNPIEYEGTYPLPEAQRDRFLVHVSIGYPDEADERRIVELPRRGVTPATLEEVQPVVTEGELETGRRPVRRARPPAGWRTDRADRSRARAGAGSRSPDPAAAEAHSA